MIRNWYEFEIINPDGIKETTVVIGEGRSEGEAFVNAKSAASLVAGQKDDAAHLPTGSYAVGKGREYIEWR